MAAVLRSPPLPPAAPAATGSAPAAEASFAHVPVLLDAVLELAAMAAPRTILDCTVGGGGHAAALLAAWPAARLVGLDRDPAALAAAGRRLAAFGDRVTLCRTPFSAAADAVADANLGPVDLVLADFGVSSPQLDRPARGFSFRGPAAALDMRMDPAQARTAQDLLAEVDEAELTRLIATLGEERYPRRVARAILRARPTTTTELAEVVRQALPPARDGRDPATRTFQALRMAVNDELGQIAALLAALPALLAPGGVALAVSFHSLEDRAVKQAFARGARPCTCPKALPVCLCGAVATLAPLTRRPRRPDPAECAANPRSRSARLRAARRLPDPP